MTAAKGTVSSMYWSSSNGAKSAMEWLHIDSLNQLTDIMYANGRVMPGHQEMDVAPETRALLRRITKKPAIVPDR